MADFAEKTADLYRLVADSSHDWECWHGTDLSLLYVSPSCQTVTGYSPDEFCKTPDLYFRIVHPDDLEKVTQHCSGAPEDLEELELEYRIVHRDGTIRWISHFCRAIHDSRGRLLGRRSTNRDMTRLKELQECLTESQKKLAGTLDAARAGVWQLDINTLRVTADRNAVGCYGLAPGTIDAMILKDKIHPDDVEAVTGRVRKAIEDKADFSIDFRTLQQDGRIRWVCLQGRYSQEPDGPQMSGLVWDVTESRQQSHELLRLQQELQKLAQFPQQNPDPVMQFSAAGDVVYMNPAATELFGPLNLKPGQPAPEEFTGSVRQALADGQRVHRFVPAGRRLVWLTFAPVQGSVNAYGRDFTEHKRSEDYFRLLSETASLLLTSEEPQATVENFCTAVMQHLECDCFFNYLLDESTNRLHLNAWAGIDDAAAQSIEWLDFGVAVCGRVASLGQRIVVEDVQHSTDQRTALVKSFGVQAYAGHPLTGPGGRVIGTLSFGTCSRTVFSPEDLSLMKTVADLTATAMYRMQIQKALRDSQSDLARAQSVVHLGSWRLNSDRSLDWSDETYRIFGIPVGSPVNDDTLKNAIHPDDRPLLRECWQQALQGRPFECEHRILARGQVKWVHQKAELEFDDQGQLVDAFGTVQDITQARLNAEALVQAQSSLANNNQLLESVLNNTHVLVACMDRQFNFVRVNLAYANADYRPVDFFPGKNHFDLYPNAENQAIFQRVVDTGEPYMVYARKFEYAGSPERGPSYWDWSLVPIKEADGQVRQVVLTLADVTHQKLSEDMHKRIMRRQAAQVRASEEILKAENAESLLQTISQTALTITNAQIAVAESTYRKQVYSNVACSSGQMSHWTPDTVFKMARRSVCREVFETGQSLCLTDAQLRAHPRWEDLPGDHMPINGLVAAPLVDRSGQVNGIIMVTCKKEQAQFIEEDETELRHLAAISSLALQHLEVRQQLARERDLLEQRVRKRTEDLERTVNTLGEEVMQRVKAESELQATNEELQRRAERLSKMASELTVAEHRERYRLAQVLHDHLQQLLVAAKLELSTVARKIAHTEAGKVIDSVMGLLKESIQESRLLTVELYPPILHEAGLIGGLEWLVRWMQDKHGFHVKLDAQGDVNIKREDICILLFQSIRELLFNSVKHSGVSKAQLIVRRKGDFVQLTIRDEGMGFDPQKLHERTEKMNGGFGLFSIRERLTSLGGQLEIVSAPNAGATFVLKAPADIALNFVSKTQPSKRKIQDVCVLPARQAAKAAGIRILLVDDHTIMRRGLATLLRQESDMQVVGEAADGSEAVRLARQLRPDVILMDFSLPGMNGAEATQIICEELPTVRVIGLSMFDEQDRAAAMFEAGASAYASKSESPTILLTAIRSVAAKSAGAPRADSAPTQRDPDGDPNP